MQDDYELVEGVWAPRFVTNTNGVVVPRQYEEGQRLNRLFEPLCYGLIQAVKCANEYMTIEQIRREVLSG